MAGNWKMAAKGTGPAATETQVRSWNPASGFVTFSELRHLFPHSSFLCS